MKATIDLPDELYRRVKARSAEEGRRIRVVAAELFGRWLDQETARPSESAPPVVDAARLSPAIAMQPACARPIHVDTDLADR